MHPTAHIPITHGPHISALIKTKREAKQLISFSANIYCIGTTFQLYSIFRVQKMVTCRVRTNLISIILFSHYTVNLVVDMGYIYFVENFLQKRQPLKNLCFIWGSLNMEFFYCGSLFCLIANRSRHILCVRPKLIILAIGWCRIPLPNQLKLSRLKLSPVTFTANLLKLPVESEGQPFFLL